MIKKILWIDDMQNWASIVQTNLQLIAANHDVHLIIMSRSNGEDLELIFRDFDFDLIVMDYHMEPFNGDHYIRQIREEEHLESIPILFYSQDTEINLNELVSDINNVKSLFRTNLEDGIREIFHF